MGIDQEIKMGQQEKSENVTPKSLFEWAFGFSPGNVNLDPISLQEGEIIGKNPRYGTVERDLPIM